MLTDKHLDFRPIAKHSSVTVLASFAGDVLSNMERGNLCGAVFLDLSKAFDTVDHSILLAKLCSLGLTPNAVQWFQSYLSHRKQRTSLRQRDLRSSTYYLWCTTREYPGALTFPFYINDLPTAVN